MARRPEPILPPDNCRRQYKIWQDQIEQVLPDYVGVAKPDQGGLAVEAARYSLLSGGKRLRPVLLLATAAMLGLSADRVMPFAAAVEMIHTYSLIHDDLPCMDNDDLRRGQPTCHKVYGEAMAVLAGDFLLNRACEVLLDAVDLAWPETVTAARLISRAAGGRGMIGGQVLDLTSAHKTISVQALQQLHRMKTGALLSAPVEAAAVLARARQQDLQALTAFGAAIGLAFQIRDDILDVTADAATLGKTTGKDDRDGKSTYVTMLGLTKADQRLRRAALEAETALDIVKQNHDVSFLRDLTRQLTDRIQ